MRSTRVQAALHQSQQPTLQAKPHETAPTRRFAIGDPQTSRQHFFSILEHHNLLGDDGFLSPEVVLLSIGDHFDYPGAPEEVGQEGLLILRWLAAHAPTQVTLLAGNHDLCRVMELAPLSDEDFRAARAMAAPIKEAEKQQRDVTAQEAAFSERFPSLPSPGIATKDFLGYQTSQRALIQSLLLTGRMQLSAVARLSSGQDALLTHAAVTHRELEILELSQDATPNTIAEALNQRLTVAVQAVRERWESGQHTTPLDLAPLHVAGVAGQEGGGLTYHRPANPYRPGSDTSWEFASSAPRRFDPRELPIGLVQVCGHTGHKKCLKDLGEWVSQEARSASHSSLRTLRASQEEVRYEPGLSTAHQQQATLYMIDAHMHSTEPASYPLFAIEDLR